MEEKSRISVEDLGVSQRKMLTCDKVLSFDEVVAEASFSKEELDRLAGPAGDCPRCGKPMTVGDDEAFGSCYRCFPGIESLT